MSVKFRIGRSATDHLILDLSGGGYRDYLQLTISRAMYALDVVRRRLVSVDVAPLSERYSTHRQRGNAKRSDQRTESMVYIVHTPPLIPQC